MNPESNCECLEFYHKTGFGASTERHSCISNIKLIILELCSRYTIQYGINHFTRMHSAVGPPSAS